MTRLKGADFFLVEPAHQLLYRVRGVPGGYNSFFPIRCAFGDMQNPVCPHYAAGRFALRAADPFLLDLFLLRQFAQRFHSAMGHGLELQFAESPRAGAIGYDDAGLPTSHLLDSIVIEFVHY